MAWTTSGNGTYVLAQTHYMGASGQNVTWKNLNSGVCWTPVWQGQSQDGSVVYAPTIRQLAGSQTLFELNGAVNLGGTPVPYTLTDTITSGLAASGAGVSFTQVVLYPAETYTSALTWQVFLQPTGLQVANVIITGGCIANTAFTINLDYPLDARVGDVIDVKLLKADGTALLTRPGMTNGTQAYRSLKFRTFTEVALSGGGGGSSQIASPDTNTKVVATNGNLTTTVAGNQRITITSGGMSHSSDTGATFTNMTNSTWAVNTVNGARVNVTSDTTYVTSGAASNGWISAVSDTDYKVTGLLGAARLTINASSAFLQAPAAEVTGFSASAGFVSMVNSGVQRISADTTFSTIASFNSQTTVRVQDSDIYMKQANIQRFLMNSSASTMYSPNGGQYIQVTNGAVNGSLAYTNASDKRLKTEMQAIPDALLDVWPEHVKWGTYQMLAQGDESRHHIGVYAQDIIAAFDAASLDYTQWGIVSLVTMPNGEQRYGVSYNDVMAIEHALLRRFAGIANELPKPSLLAKMGSFFKSKPA